MVPVDEVDPLADLRPWPGSRTDRGSWSSLTTSSAQSGQARVRTRRRSTALIVYFDTSALIRLIFDEPGSELAEDLYAQLRIIAIDEPLARHAGHLAAQHSLRGCDAVHLACALRLEGDKVLLATWDNALNAAARATGRLIANATD